MKKKLLSLCASLLFFHAIQAANPAIRFKHEATDTATINNILIEAAANVKNARPEQRVAYIAKMFIDKPYVAGTLEGDTEVLTINMDEVDPTGHNGMLLEYAKWEPGDGRRKGGCGVYYLDDNFLDVSGIPYNAFRQAIQIMNPAVPY